MLVIDTSLKDEFRKNLAEWKEYAASPEVIVWSMDWKYRDCVAYRNIVNMGMEALPLIRDACISEEYSEFAIWGYAHIVREIIGEEFDIPPIFGNLFREREICKHGCKHGETGLVAAYTAGWLEGYLKDKEIS